MAFEKACSEFTPNQGGRKHKKLDIRDSFQMGVSYQKGQAMRSFQLLALPPSSGVRGEMLEFELTNDRAFRKKPSYKSLEYGVQRASRLVNTSTCQEGDAPPSPPPSSTGTEAPVLGTLRTSLYAILHLYSLLYNKLVKVKKKNRKKESSERWTQTVKQESDNKGPRMTDKVFGNNHEGKVDPPNRFQPVCVCACTCILCTYVHVCE